VQTGHGSGAGCRSVLGDSQPDEDTVGRGRADADKRRTGDSAEKDCAAVYLDTTAAAETSEEDSVAGWIGDVLLLRCVMVDGAVAGNCRWIAGEPLLTGVGLAKLIKVVAVLY
jgi:hypothetical protein